jgi:hypothetical protein
MNVPSKVRELERRMKQQQRRKKHRKGKAAAAREAPTGYIAHGQAQWIKE